MLRELVRDIGADGVAGLLPGRATRELARLLPEFGQPGSDGDAGEARGRLFEQMLSLLGRLADRGVSGPRRPGRSNREIADQLFISVKTASVHVSNILAKLSAGSRGEAAATAHRLRLFDPAPSS